MENRDRSRVLTGTPVQKKEQSKEKVLIQIKSFPGISEAVRNKAEEMASLYEAALGRRNVRSNVHRLFEEIGLRDEVINHLRRTMFHSNLDESLAIAARHPERSDSLNRLSWKAVRVPSRQLGEYQLAVRQAEKACELSPSDGNCVNTLGIAQFRAGRYQSALETLARSEPLNRNGDDSHPADVAFLAMTHHRLGNSTRARECLRRLRGIMQGDGWAKDNEAFGFLRETEELIEGKLH